MSSSNAITKTNGNKAKRVTSKYAIGPLCYYKSAQEFSDKIDEYMETIGEDNPPTLTGLTLFLGYVDIQSLYDMKARPAFSAHVKRAVTFIQNYHEKRVAGSQSCPNSMFWLKCQAGYREQDNDGPKSVAAANIKIHLDVVAPK